jgi:NAD+ synthase
MPQSQEEFYFSIPWNQMDVCLYAKLHQISPESVTDALGMSVVQLRRIFRLIEGQQRAAEYLHSAPLLPPSKDESPHE